jgi:dissimilatory sulfite reductase (desulfoviridin) alpha/beta subunit
MTDVSLKEYLDRCRSDIIARCTLCGNCAVNCEIRRYAGVKDEHPIRLVGAMGLEVQPDKMKQFRDLRDPSSIIKAARTAIESSIYDEDEVSSVLPFLFR